SGADRQAQIDSSRTNAGDRKPSRPATGTGPLSGQPAASGGTARLRPIPAAASERFTSVSFEILGQVDLQRLADELIDPALGVLRAKGLMRDRDGTSKSLQLVGSRAELRESMHEDPARGRFVCIGLRDRFDRDAITAR